MDSCLGHHEESGISIINSEFRLLKRLRFYIFNSESKILGLTGDFVAAALHMAV